MLQTSSKIPQLKCMSVQYVLGNNNSIAFNFKYVHSESFHK